MSRRQFLMQSACGATALLLGSMPIGAGSRPPLSTGILRILILGGTGFIGPHFVHAAIARGHKISVFNRGKSEAALPQNVEHLVGDRNSDLSAIKDRDWDAVIDLATYAPGWVQRLGEAIGHRVRHYTFISTVLVYDYESIEGTTDESSPLLMYRGKEHPDSAAQSGKFYGPLKVLCEREAENQFPGRTLTLRPGYIVGPGDPQGYLTYWPARMEKGGEIMVASCHSTPVQFIDVRDLADWSIRMVEKNAVGIFNAVGPAIPTNLGQLVNTARVAASNSVTIMWVTSSWLAAREDRETWRNLLFWSHETEGFGKIMQTSMSRAVIAGLATRRMSTTLADTFEWYKEQRRKRQQTPISARSGKGEDERLVISTSWTDYLKSEKETLAAWRAEQVDRRREPDKSGA